MWRAIRYMLEPVVVSDVWVCAVRLPCTANRQKHLNARTNEPLRMHWNWWMRQRRMNGNSTDAQQRFCHEQQATRFSGTNDACHAMPVNARSVRVRHFHLERDTRAPLLRHWRKCSAKLAIASHFISFPEKVEAEAFDVISMGLFHRCHYVIVYVVCIVQEFVAEN